MAWAEFILAFLIFFASHSIPVRPPVKPWIVLRVGAKAFAILYSALSLAVLWWLIVAAGRAPYVELWPWAPWQSHVTLAVMLPVCLILAVSIARPNPFSFGGSANEAFDPNRPGIVRWTRHPLLMALALWATAHFVSNGDLAHVLLFGSFAAFALVGGRMVNRRRQREMGEQWQRLSMLVQRGNIIPRPSYISTFAIRIALGVGLFFALIAIHPFVIGVDPLS